MYSKVRSGSLRGIGAVPIEVETDVSFGFPTFNIVGLPDAAIRESRERIRSAIVNSGLRFPENRVTVNLSPADLRKEGACFDLPVAIAILLAGGGFVMGDLHATAFIGELALNGSVNPVRGVLTIVLALREAGISRVFVPQENAYEASMVEGVRVLGVDSLKQTIDCLTGASLLKATEYTELQEMPLPQLPDFSEVAGQDNIKRAAQIACAAMHNLLMLGPPGSGKSMIARRLPSIMPPLTYEEKLEVTAIYSACGALEPGRGVIQARPFRSPDHTVTVSALIGGGSRIQAGEVTLAHGGVLFLDELPEFKRSAIEALRRPMEDECVTISRVHDRLVLPSRFLLAAAMNPCPCGYLGDSRHTCSCTEQQIYRYRSKLSGPFMDRIDLAVEVPVPNPEDIRNNVGGTSSSLLREAVERAHDIQRLRFKDESIHYNSQMTSNHIKQFCRLDENGEELLKNAFIRLKLSARSYHRTIKVARTIADMDGRDNIMAKDIAEALSYRLDG